MFRHGGFLCPSQHGVPRPSGCTNRASAMDCLGQLAFRAATPACTAARFEPEPDAETPSCVRSSIPADPEAARTAAPAYRVYCLVQLGEQDGTLSAQQALKRCGGQSVQPIAIGRYSAGPERSLAFGTAVASAVSVSRCSMRPTPALVGWMLGLGLVWGPATAWPEPAEPLYQMCAAAELLADVEPAAAAISAARLEVRTAVREELRATVRAELRRELPRGRSAAAPSGPRPESGPADARGAAASASDAAAQAQQARRNQDVAVARGKGQGRSPLTGNPGEGNVPARLNAR